jgi:prophage regulatory protein
MKTIDIIQAPPLLVARDVAASALGISESTLEALVRCGDLPRPRLISKGRTGWLWRELLAFAESRPVSQKLPGPGRRRAAQNGQTGD